MDNDEDDDLVTLHGVRMVVVPPTLGRGEGLQGVHCVPL